MKKGIFQEFDRYDEVVRELEASRKYASDYSAARDSAEQYINRYHPASLRLRVSDIIEETSSTKTFRFVSEDQYLPPFQAGQYLAVKVNLGSVVTSRPYSISSAPNQTGYYDLTVRRVDRGLVSNFFLDKVEPNQVFEVSGPHGNFCFNPLFHGPDMVLLAGGSGITPFMSIIREIVECGIRRNVYLFYGSKNLDDVLFHRALTDMAAKFPNIRYFPVLENPPVGYQGCRGLMTGALIKEKLGNLEGKTYYLCGPQAMYDFCVAQLEELGVPRRKIRRELYGPPSDPSRCDGWPTAVNPDQVFSVSISGRGKVQARAGETLLSVLEKNGLVVPSICRSGECSMCRVKVVSGQVFQPPGALVRKSDQRFGYVHSCVSYPLQDLEIII
jgi:ferredoxin-NADP reductase